MSLGLRVSESSFGISMTQSFVFCFSLIPSYKRTRPRPSSSTLSTFILPILIMSSPVNAFSFEVSIPFLVVFEMTNVGDTF